MFRIFDPLKDFDQDFLFTQGFVIRIFDSLKDFDNDFLFNQRFFGACGGPGPENEDFIYFCTAGAQK